MPCVRRSPRCTWPMPRPRRSTSIRRCARKRAITADEEEHGEEEHAEGHEALLAVLELKGTDTQAFDDAVEELAKKVNHHLTEEELTILNPAREEVSEPSEGRSRPGVRHRAQRATGRRLRSDRECPLYRGPRREGRPARRERVQSSRLSFLFSVVWLWTDHPDNPAIGLYEPQERPVTSRGVPH